MFLRIAVIGFIWFATSVAWMFLGSTIQYRTTQSDMALKSKVESTWGGEQWQSPPWAGYTIEEEREEVEVTDGKKTVRTKKHKVNRRIEAESSRLWVDVQLNPRQKGLLWYSTFGYSLRGVYRFRNPGDQAWPVRFALPFPSQHGVYDDVQILVNGKPAPVEQSGQHAETVLTLPPSGTSDVEVRFRAQGLDFWRYKFGEGVGQVRDFQLSMTTNFEGIDFPENTLSPTQRTRSGDGWKLEWTYRNMVSGSPIALAMPKRIQPGPLSGEISYFAPVSLLFFFFVILLLTTLRGIELHPVNYFFLAASFFAFHLLLAYLADHVAIHAAFLICSAVSVALLVSYLRIVTGARFAMREAAGAQIVYLILFSYAFFFEGYTGLAITVVAILTLFVAMQATARVNWTEVFESGKIPGARPPAPQPAAQ
ncbi:MAG: inner membrane CreD family protein [Acidobacteriota bacterium]